MQFRELGRTGLKVSALGFGASPLGQEFRQIDMNEGIRAVRVALDCGMNFIDTSPFYGRGMSEVLLGVALRDVRRDQYLLGTKLGRYSVAHFDFSARRVVESVDISLERMRTDYLDICLCHDVEFVDMSQIVEETLPALRKVQGGDSTDEPRAERLAPRRIPIRRTIPRLPRPSGSGPSGTRRSAGRRC